MKRMKNYVSIPNLISSIGVTIILIQLMIKSPSPKLIFVPFIICSSSMVGMNVAKILKKQKLQVVFHKLFVGGFLMFFLGFFVVANYINIRDKNYNMLIFSIPFWLVGISMIKNKLLNKERKQNGETSFPFAIIISALLVGIVLLAGIFLLVFGIREADVPLIFSGMFFTFGSFTFVLAALTIRGCFDKINIDVLGVYTGIVIMMIGSGTIGVKFIETYSWLKTIETFGAWILIPILMITIGILQIVKCLAKNKRK